MWRYQPPPRGTSMLRAADRRPEDAADAMSWRENLVVLLAVVDSVGTAVNDGRRTSPGFIEHRPEVRMVGAGAHAGLLCDRVPRLNSDSREPRWFGLKVYQEIQPPEALL